MTSHSMLGACTLCGQAGQAKAAMPYAVGLAPGLAWRAGTDDFMVYMWNAATGTVMQVRVWRGAMRFAALCGAVLSACPAVFCRVYPCSSHACAHGWCGVRLRAAQYLAVKPAPCPHIVITIIMAHPRCMRQPVSWPSVDGWVTCVCVQVFSGHSGTVTAGCFTPDGKSVVTVGGEDDASLRVWNPKSGECTATLQGHPFHAEGERGGQLERIKAVKPECAATCWRREGGMAPTSSTRAHRSCG